MSENTKAVIKRFILQRQAAAHYRVPFDSQGWFDSLCREYDLTPKQAETAKKHIGSFTLV